jgi:hypothetical protein
MSVWGPVRSIAAAIFRRDRIDSEMDEELRLHIQNRADAFLRDSFTGYSLRNAHAIADDE